MVRFSAKQDQKLKKNKETPKPVVKAGKVKKQKIQAGLKEVDKTEKESLLTEKESPVIRKKNNLIRFSITGWLCTFPVDSSPVFSEFIVLENNLLKQLNDSRWNNFTSFFPYCKRLLLPYDFKAFFIIAGINLYNKNS